MRCVVSRRIVVNITDYIKNVVTDIDTLYDDLTTTTTLLYDGLIRCDDTAYKIQC